MNQRAKPKPTTVIAPTSGWRAFNLSDLWRYSELLMFMAWRDIKLRYKQTIIGGVWTIIQPLMTTGVFTLLFGILMGKGNEPTVSGVPYALCTFCAMLPWQFFANTVSYAGSSMVTNRRIITKVYFPRLIIPMSALISSLFDFLVALLFLLAALLLWADFPTVNAFSFPLFLGLGVTLAFGCGMWLAALTAIYRDFRYVVPFIVQVGLFVCPVVYTLSSIKGQLSGNELMIYKMNPMVGVIEGIRWSLLGVGQPPDFFTLVCGTAVTLLVFVSGLAYFRKMEGTIADVI